MFITCVPTKESLTKKSERSLCFFWLAETRNGVAVMASDRRPDEIGSGLQLFEILPEGLRFVTGLNALAGSLAVTNGGYLDICSTGGSFRNSEL